MDRKFYVINYAETVRDGCSVGMDFGTFDYGFDSLDDAKRSLVDIGQRRVDGFDEDEQKNLIEKWSEDGERLTIECLGDPYEYSVKCVIVPNCEK